MPDDKDNGILATIGAGLPVVGSAVNAIAQGIQNKKARQFSEKMYGRQRADALADWHMQNAYNSPEAQMERLKAAGLNPNLVYGNGADAQSSSAVRSSSSQSWNPQAPQIDLSGTVSGFLDVKVRQAQLDNLAAQRQLMEADLQTKRMQPAKIAADIAASTAGTNLKQKDIEWYDTVKQASMESIAASINQRMAQTQYTIDENQRKAIMLAPNFKKAVESILLMEANREVSKARKAEIYQKIDNLKKSGALMQWEIDLNKSGASKRDPLWQRQVMEAANEILDGGIKNTIKDIKKGASGIFNMMDNK